MKTVFFDLSQQSKVLLTFTVLFLNEVGLLLSTAEK